VGEQVAVILLKFYNNMFISTKKGVSLAGNAFKKNGFKKSISIGCL